MSLLEQPEATSSDGGGEKAPRLFPDASKAITWPASSSAASTDASLGISWGRGNGTAKISGAEKRMRYIKERVILDMVENVEGM